MKRLVPWFGPLIVLILEVPFIWTSPHVGEWFAFWYAGHVIARGASVYDPTAWVSAARDYGPVAHGIAINTSAGVGLTVLEHDSRWIWPPMVGILLAPFGALPVEVGVPLLHLTTIGVAIASTIALTRVLVPSPLRPLALTLLFASPSLVQPMRAATMTILVLPGFALLFAALRVATARRLALAALLVAVRPQLFVLTLPPVAAVFVRHGALRLLATAALLWSAAQAIAFALSPVPLDPRLLDAARAFTLQDNSSTWRLAYELLPDAVLPAAAVLIAFAAALAIVAVRRAAPDRRDDVLVAAALAVAIAVVPYAHTYDHVALFPIWLLAIRAGFEVTGSHRVAIGVGVVAIALGYAWSAYLVGAAGFRAAIGVTPYLGLALLAMTSRTSHPPSHS